MTLPDGTYPVTVEEAAGVLKERHAERAEAKGAAKADKKKDSEVLGEEQFLIKNLDFSYLPDVPVLKALNMSCLLYTSRRSCAVCRMRSLRSS